MRAHSTGLCPGRSALVPALEATLEEASRSLRGDALVPYPKQISTRAITIRANAAGIWPWLVQIGQGRGGFYSYDWLENWVGSDIDRSRRCCGTSKNEQKLAPIQRVIEDKPNVQSCL